MRHCREVLEAAVAQCDENGSQWSERQFSGADGILLTNFNQALAKKLIVVITERSFGMHC